MAADFNWATLAGLELPDAILLAATRPVEGTDATTDAAGFEPNLLTLPAAAADLVETLTEGLSAEFA